MSTPGAVSPVEAVSLLPEAVLSEELPEELESVLEEEPPSLLHAVKLSAIIPAAIRAQKILFFITVSIPF